MQVTFSTVLPLLLSFALGEAIHNSRSSPNLSQLLTHSGNLKRSPQPWYKDTAPVAANEYLWGKAVEKGTTLLEAMSYSDADAGQTFVPPRYSAESLWSLEHLKPWGWNIYPNYGPSWCNWEDSGHWGIANYVRSNGLSDKCVEDGGLWDISVVVHGECNDFGPEPEEQRYTGPDGKEHRVTAAEYNIGINGKQGGIIAFKRYGPAQRAKEMDPPVPEDDFPPLKSSSDIMWALWEKLVLSDAALENKGNIKFFMSLSVENEETLTILKRALDQVSSDLTREGRTFDMSTEEGRAILGSPNAVAFAYFLIQHKTILGKKIIDSVHVMECETSHKSPCLYFSVKGYEEYRKPPTQL